MMQIEKPNIKYEEENNGRVANFVLEPLNKGYGLTIGNALRRTLLSALPGAAITGVKVDGVPHEFSTIKGVKEDVTEIVLNLKEVVIKTNSDEQDFKAVLKIKKQGEGVVTAGDIEFNDQVEVINKDQIICTCDSDANLNMELFVSRGLGYVPATEQEKNNEPIGYIAIDAIYSPVTLCNFKVENARVGQSIDFDKLFIEVVTNGAYTAKEVIALSAKIINDHINLFVELVENMANINIIVAKEEDKASRILEMTIDDMDLKPRSSNGLKRAGINTVEELVKKSREEVSKIRNLGLNSLKEIEDKILSYGLNFRNDEE